jgi:hypothetical protein
MKAARVRLILAAVVLVGAAATGCSKARDAVTRGTSETQALSASPVDCGHAVCSDDFFVDAVPATCTAGSPCNVTLKLVATGDFHVNDEYPYKFKADDVSGVTFLGTDQAGKSTFSKAAGDWQKTDAKSGAMTVKFVPADANAKSIAGTLKLSVCSAGTCLLEQRQVTASVTTK